MRRQKLRTGRIEQSSTNLIEGLPTLTELIAKHKNRKEELVWMHKEVPTYIRRTTELWRTTTSKVKVSSSWVQKMMSSPPVLYDRTLSDNNIQMKSTLHLVLYVRSGIQIFVKTLTVEKITTTKTSLWKVLFRSNIVYRNLVIEHQV